MATIGHRPELRQSHRRSIHQRDALFQNAIGLQPLDPSPTGIPGQSNGFGECVNAL